MEGTGCGNERMKPMSQPDEEAPQPVRGRHRTPRHDRGAARTRHRWWFLRDVAGVFVIAILVSLLIKTLLVQAFYIPSASMEPTLHGCPRCVSDWVLVNKQTGHMGGVQRGDIVVFSDPGGWLGHGFSTPGPQSRVHEVLAFIGLAPSTSQNDLVKRVIGVAGDTVEGRDGKVYVNGVRLVEPYLFPGDSSSDVNFKVTVPADKLWVMGDHRSASGDSRFNQQGPGKGFVPVQDVLGRAFVTIWPLDRVGFLGRPATFDRPGVAPKR
jgi:signal peptidase I